MNLSMNFGLKSFILSKLNGPKTELITNAGVNPSETSLIKKTK
jgi:hypothetical protein